MKKYKWLIIGLSGGLLLIATIIICALYWNSIFNENTFAIILIVVLLVVIAFGSIILRKSKK